MELGVVLEGVLRESPYPGPGDMRLGPDNESDYDIKCILKQPMQVMQGPERLLEILHYSCKG